MRKIERKQIIVNGQNIKKKTYELLLCYKCATKNFGTLNFNIGKMGRCNAYKKVPRKIFAESENCPRFKNGN